jgi:putative phosphoesterase
MAVPDDEAGAPTPAGTRLGVIADNHGYLDPRVLELFAGVARILHAGDVIDPTILAALEVVAPLTAVAGNMDPPELAARLPREVAGQACGVRFAPVHKYKRLTKRLAEGRIDGRAAGVVPELVVYGHDHMPAAAWVEGTLFLDPGSASAPHEEDDGPTVAIVSVSPVGLAITFLPLASRALEAGSSPPG